jgi:hypothetical protein
MASRRNYRVHRGGRVIVPIALQHGANGRIANGTLQIQYSSGTKYVGTIFGSGGTEHQGRLLLGWAGSGLRYARRLRAQRGFGGI